MDEDSDGSTASEDSFMADVMPASDDEGTRTPISHNNMSQVTQELLASSVCALGEDRGAASGGLSNDQDVIQHASQLSTAALSGESQRTATARRKASPKATKQETPVIRFERVDPELDNEAKREAIIASFDKFALDLGVLLMSLLEDGGDERPSIAVEFTSRSSKSNGDQLRRFTYLSARSSTPEASGFGSRKLAQLLCVMQLLSSSLKCGDKLMKRDIYYHDVALFGSQSAVNSIVEDLPASLGLRRADLGIIASAKGLFAGHLNLSLVNGTELKGGVQSALIPTRAEILSMDTSDLNWVLVIEKDSAFYQFCTPSFLNGEEGHGKGVVLTGKGYPDLSTRELLSDLKTAKPSLRIFCLVDSDPHGLSILATFAFGSASMAYDPTLAVPTLEWLGLKGSEWDSLGVSRTKLLPITPADRRKALSMLKSNKTPLGWKRELEYMLHLGYKAELQVLMGTGAGEEGEEGSALVRYATRKLCAALS